MKSKISERGQVTVPKACRDRLGLVPGTVIHFEAVDGKLIGVKVGNEDGITRWRGRGHLPDTEDVDAYLARIRG